MFRKVLITAISSVLILGTLSLATSPASAAPCGYGSPVDLQSAFTSQTFAGVETTTNIPFIYKYSNAGCLQGMIFTFVGGGGTDVQAIRASVTSSGVSGVASVKWVPKALEYSLLVDIVYEYGSYGSVDTSRWTYKSPITGSAFKSMPAPSAPQLVRLTGEDRNLNVSWGYPALNSTSVTKYVVKYPDGRVLCEGMAQICTAREQPDGTYAFIVTAVNALGVGAEVATNPIVVGPPTPPGFSRVVRTSKGKKLNLYWSVATGTTAKARVFRVYDQNGTEVCGTPAASSPDSVMSCTVTPAKSGSRYVLKVETNMGVSESGPSTTFKPLPKKKKPKKSR